MSQGNGWWQASDGRWYPPEQHPDPGYRQAFAPPPSVAPPSAPPQPAVPPPTAGWGPPTAFPPTDAVPSPNTFPPSSAFPAPNSFPAPGPTTPPGAYPGPGQPPTWPQPAMAAPTKPGRAKWPFVLGAAVLVVLLVLVAGVVAVRANRSSESVSATGGVTDDASTRPSGATPTTRPSGGTATTRTSATTARPSSTGPATATSASAPTNAGSGKGSRRAPLAVGETFTVKNRDLGDVDVKINRFTVNATDQIMAANSFNDPPPAGSQYAIFNATYTYHAGTQSQALNGLLLAVTVSGFGKSAVEINTYNCGAVLPDALDTFADLLDGGSVTGNECLVLSAADAAGPLLLRVQETLCFDGCDEGWFQLQ